MLTPTSNQSASSDGSGVKTSSTASERRRTMPILSKISRSKRKQRSLYLNEAEFEFCQVPDANEMLRSAEYLATLANEPTNSAESSTSDNTISDPQPNHSMYPTSRPAGHRNDLISNLKHRLKPNRSETSKRDDYNQELNDGFLLFDQHKAELVFIPNDQMDSEHTRHAEPCVHGEIDEDDTDDSESQSISMTPLTPSLLPPTQPSRPIPSSALLPMNHTTINSDIQATQASVECAALVSEVSNVQETQVSLTNSSSSTNSSNTDGQLTSTDRTTLDDDHYVQEQKNDLDRITFYEIALSDDRRDDQRDLDDSVQRELEEYGDFELTRDYNSALERNSRLKEEFKRLNDDHARTHLRWSCEICTYINEAYIVTGRDDCDMCQGPSPLKRHALTS